MQRNSDEFDVILCFLKPYHVAVHSDTTKRTICVDLFISVLRLISIMSSESSLVIVFFRSAILNSSCSLRCRVPIFISESKSSNPFTIAASFSFVDGCLFSAMVSKVQFWCNEKDQGLLPGTIMKPLRVTLIAELPTCAMKRREELPLL